MLYNRIAKYEGGNVSLTSLAESLAGYFRPTIRAASLKTAWCIFHYHKLWRQSRFHSICREFTKDMQARRCTEDDTMYEALFVRCGYSLAGPHWHQRLSRFRGANVGR